MMTLAPKQLQLLILILTLFFSNVFAKSLENHASPYLRMHETDPVKWQTWSDEVLEQAQKENKLIYLSIGYFSCHWCHVMQKESYSNQEIGEILNENFIAVKVDRELRPELDRRMIQFVEKVHGQAGWPLNVFITPKGYPVTGFTYLPKDNFERVLLGLSIKWQNQHQKITQAAEKFFLESEDSESKSELLNISDEHFEKVVDAFINQAMLIADQFQGGFGETNKFPSYPQLNALLHVIKHKKSVDDDLISFFKLTLDSMSSKHLMDHVNNGFYRYATDPNWDIPHFEKMLYDNAHLATLYFDAHKLWPDEGYAETGLKTLRFMDKFLSTKSGAYNTSLSAVDENNIEGGAYYWSVNELKQALTKQDYFELQKQWQFLDDQEQIQSEVINGDKILVSRITRQLRDFYKVPMPIDTKRLASWNALALKAWVRASEVNPTIEVKQKTKSLYKAIKKLFIINGEVVRFAGLNQSAETTLEDYAQIAHAFSLYAKIFKDTEAAKLAQQIIDKSFTRYFVKGRWIQDTQTLIPGDKGQFIIQDGVLESPVSLLLEAVLLNTFNEKRKLTRVNKIIKRLTRDVLDVPYYYGSAIMLRKRYENRLR